MKFPLTIQIGTNDCGPTCLKMIADFYGLDFRLTYLKRKFKMTKAGVSMLDIHKAAETIGLESTGIKINIEQLKKIAQDTPVIFHYNENHFVIIYKAPRPQKKGQFFVADPSRGLVKYKEEEFLKFWSGYHQQGNSSIKSKENLHQFEGCCLLLELAPSYYKQKRNR
jgi:ATP-binding cassette subfamily B protein